MDVTMIKALYFLCSMPQAEKSEGAKLHRQYLYLREADRAQDALDSLVGTGTPEELDTAIGQCLSDTEMQGFVNGFRFGAMMAGELTDNLTRSLGRPKSPQDGGTDVGGAGCYVG